MRHFFGLLVLVFLSSCIVDSPVETVDKILAKKTYQFSIEHCGSFGCGKDRVVVKIDGDNSYATHYFLDRNWPNRPRKKSKRLAWGPEKTEAIRKIFKEGLKQGNSSVVCTTESTYKLSGSWLAVTFDDRACKFSGELAILRE